MSTVKDQINKNRIPHHIAIIMDGNGRWAQQHGEKRVFGHRNGVAPIRACIEGCRELGIQYLTLYAFSTENWNRPLDEVNELMNLLVKTTRDEVDSLVKNEVRLQFIGDIDRLYPETQQAIAEATALTANCSKLTVNIALSYSSKWEIVRAVKKISKDICNDVISIDDVSDELFGRYLETSGTPDPEMLIRTGGEQRVSNFLLWQIAYSELYFTDVMWPDFSKEEFFTAIVDYQSRERRFGKTSEQVKNT